MIKLYENNSEELMKVAWVVVKFKRFVIMNYKNTISKQKNYIRWNMFPMHKREMFGHNWQDGDDKTPFFIKYSYIWHFTGFPIEDRTK